MRISTLIASLVLASSALSSAELPITEGFEGGVVPPAGWDLFVTDVDYTWEITSAIAHSGTFAAQVPWDPDAFEVQNEFLISPSMIVSEATVSFWSMSDVFWCRDVHNACELFVWLIVGEVGDGDDIMVGKADDDWTGTDVWSPSTLDLTPFLPGGGMAVRVAFNFMGWSEREGVALDDIVIVGESIPDDQIFSDDFESGDTSRWSSVSAPSPKI